jgi:hypothetical protein
MEHDGSFHVDGGHNDASALNNDTFEEPTYYVSADSGNEHEVYSGDIALLPQHLDAAVADAVERSGFDAATDKLTDGYLSDIQGITAEYLVADALNHAGDGLSYALYSDPSHPNVDIAGFAPDGTLVRLLQVKATSSPWYAETGHHPGVEVIVTPDGFRSGMEMMSVSAATLRAEIRDIIAQNRTAFS